MPPHGASRRARPGLRLPRPGPAGRRGVRAAGARRFTAVHLRVVRGGTGGGRQAPDLAGIDGLGCAQVHLYADAPRARDPRHDDTAAPTARLRPGGATAASLHRSGRSPRMPPSTCRRSTAAATASSPSATARAGRSSPSGALTAASATRGRWKAQAPRRSRSTTPKARVVAWWAMMASTHGRGPLLLHRWAQRHEWRGYACSSTPRSGRSSPRAVGSSWPADGQRRGGHPARHRRRMRAIRSTRSVWRSFEIERSRVTAAKGPYLALRPAIPLIDSAKRAYVTWTGVSHGAPVVKLARIDAGWPACRTVLSRGNHGSRRRRCGRLPRSVARGLLVGDDRLPHRVHLRVARRGDGTFAAPVQLTPTA